MNEIIDLVKSIVSEVDKTVKRVYWTNEQIDEFFAKRSAKNIIQDGTTCYMNPCLDLTLISAHLMSLGKIPYEFVIEEHFPTSEFPFNRLHFAIEFQERNDYKNYNLNYKRVNEVYLSEGNYNGREDIPLAQIIRMSGGKINPDNPIYKNLGYNNLNDLVKDRFHGYSLESNLSRLKQDNSEKNYKLYKEKYGEEFNIITKLQNQS